MKTAISMLLILIAVTSLCIWDGIHTYKVFEHMESESNSIYESLLVGNVSDEDIQKKIFDLDEYWTKKMDTLCISISRKDLQPVSDYLQYLHSSVINSDQDDAITYSRLLNYNVVGLRETTGLNMVNLL